MTYWALNAVFLAVAAILAVIARRRMNWPAVALTGLVVLVMTAAFDNVMIAVGLVAYNPDRISGVFIGIAPLEDFAYSVAAVLGLPALWSILSRRGVRAADAPAISGSEPGGTGTTSGGGGGVS